MLSDVWLFRMKLPGDKFEHFRFNNRHCFDPVLLLGKENQFSLHIQLLIDFMLCDLIWGSAWDIALEIHMGQNVINNKTLLNVHLNKYRNPSIILVTFLFRVMEPVLYR